MRRSISVSPARSRRSGAPRLHPLPGPGAAAAVLTAATMLTAAASVGLAWVAPLSAQAGTPVGAPAHAGARALFDSAYTAWDAGAYDIALARLDRLLAGPGAEAMLADVAVLTGERYRTVQVSAHGTNPRWSPDGRHAAFDVPAGLPGGHADGSPVTVIVGIRNGAVEPVARVDGYGAVFSPDGDRIAWLRTEPRAREARVRVRHLVTGEERDIAASEAVHAAVWSGGEVVPWVAGGAVRVSPTGTHLVYDDDEGLALLTIGTSWQRTFAGGTAPAFSADGSTLVFLARQGGRYAVRRIRLDGEGSDTRLPETIHVSDEPIASPAVSADGRRVAFEREGRENRDVWIVGEGEDARRLTHDVQHDLFPAFLSGDRLLVIKGEGRHRRSFVYPVAPGGEPEVREWVPGSGEGMRLFHNNTVRTVAPEYEWAVSPDGSMLLVVAERDGDTISPERGVYLLDLGRPVTLPEVRTRVREQMAAEGALRRRAEVLFAPIAAAVAEAVADVSVSRIYRYQADLFRFGSKHITQPGNALAIDYLVERLREFGYEPELQWFEPRPGIRSANVIVRVPGTVRSDVVYMVGTHFDSVERGPGADDNTSGTAALLEAARVLATRPQAATMELVFFTGEEAGLLGSRENARRAVADGKNVAGGLNNDMVGYANDHRLDNTIRYSSAALRDLQHAAALLFTDLILYDAHYYKNTDAHALYDAFGDVIAGIGSYPILANPHYHQEHDVLETIHHRLVAEVAKTTVASILRMASGPLP